MNAASPISSQPSLWDIPSAIFSPESERGATHSGSQGGPTTDPYGPEAAPARPSPSRAKEKGLTTLVTSGRPGIVSSASAALESSLVSRLMERLDMAGSTLFSETWKRKATPLRRRYWAHTARALPTSVSVSTSSVPTPNTRDHHAQGPRENSQSQVQVNLCDVVKKLAAVPTPQAADMTGGGQAKRALESKRPSGATASANLNDYAMLASVPTPMAGSPATETYNAAGNNDYSRRIVELARLSAVPSPCTPNGGRSCSTEIMDATGRMLDGTKHTASLEHAVKFSAVATPRSEDSQCAGAHRGSPDTLHSQANLAAVTTPPARDWKDTSGMSENGVDPDGSTRSRLDQLPRQAQLADSGPTATGGTAATASTGQLDPAYSRWLMGLPPEWCDCAATAMRSMSTARKRSSKRTGK